LALRSSGFAIIAKEEDHFIRFLCSYWGRVPVKLRSHLLLWVIVALCCLLLSGINYLLFHSVVEIITIAVAMMLVAVAYIAGRKNNLVFRIGSLYAVVLAIDILHTLSYEGINVFPSWETNHSAQFWVLARVIESSGIALALLLPACKRCNIAYTVFYAFAGATGIAMIATGVFPVCYLDGTGLTVCKVTMEYITIAIIVLTLFLLKRAKSLEIKPYRQYILYALLFTALAEFFFTLYIDPYSITPVIGHVFRLISYFVILEGVVFRSLKEPFNTLYEEMNVMVEELTEILSETTEIKDPYTRGHQKRVAEISEKLGRSLGLSQERLRDLVIACRIHDVGKLYVPTDILSKVTPVNEVEYEIIKNHVVESYNLLKGLPLNKRVFEIILQHHERIDGSGYPKGLKGDKLLLESRILAVADVIEAMNHDRPHRIAPGMAETLKELRENSGKLYDPLVVQTFFDLLEESGGMDQS